MCYDAWFTTTSAPPSPFNPFRMMSKGIVIMPVHCQHIHPRLLLVGWRKLLLLWSHRLSASDFALMTRTGRCYKQIWRRYPVNKEPAETSCEQHHSQMCDFKQILSCTRQLVIWVSLSLFFFYCFWRQHCWKLSHGSENTCKMKSGCYVFLFLVCALIL